MDNENNGECMPLGAPVPVLPGGRDMIERIFESLVDDISKAIFDYKGTKMDAASLVDNLANLVGLLHHFKQCGTVRAALNHAEQVLINAILNGNN